MHERQRAHLNLKAAVQMATIGGMAELCPGAYLNLNPGFSTQR